MILVIQRRTVENKIGKIDPFATAQRPTHFDYGVEAVTGNSRDPHDQPAIIDKNPRTWLESSEDFGVRQADTVCIPLIRGLVKSQGLSNLKDRSLGNDANAMFRALKIGQNTGWLARARLKVTNGANASTLFFLRAMRKIQAKNVHTSRHQLFQHLWRRRHAAKRGYNFGKTGKSSGIHELLS